jgi:hypothetical protein
MARIATYEDFIERAEELGFLTLFPTIPGLPSLEEETPPGIWFQDDEAADPWSWKSRAAEEKRLAYGCLLGGAKGFVAPRMYAHFFRVFHRRSVEERWRDGVLSPLAWKAWSAFQDRAAAGTRELRRLTGAKGGKLDAVLADFQRTYDLAIAGREYRIDRTGRPYGWASNLYQPVPRWVPEGWWELAAPRDRRDASEAILAAASAFGRGDLDLDALAKRWELDR